MLDYLISLITKKGVIVVNVLIKNRWILFISLFLISTCLMTFFKEIKIDSSVEVWFLKDDPTLVNYKKFKEMYGNDETITALIRPKTSIYDKNFIKEIDFVSRELESHPFVRRIFSMTSASYIGYKNDELVVEDLLPEESNLTPTQLKERFFSNPLWTKLLLNRDESAIIILIELENIEDVDSKRPVIINFVNKSLANMNYKLAGGGVIFEELNRIGMNDFSLFTLLSFSILMTLLFFFLRSSMALIASIITILLSLSIFIGVHNSLGLKLNSISIMIPTLILIICLSDIVHIFTHYEKTGEAFTHAQKLKNTFSYILLPCFFTTSTTAIGFLAFYSSPMAILKNFGILSAIGLFLAFIVSIIVSMCLLSLKKSMVSSSENAFLDRSLLSLSNWNEKNYRKIVIFGALLSLIFIYGIFFIKAETYTLNFLLKSNPIRQDAHFIEQDYGFYLPLEFRILPGEYESIKNPEFLKKLDSLYTDFKELDYVQRPTSFVDVIKQLNKVLTNNQKESYVIPKTKAAVAQEIVTYEMDPDNEMNYFTDFTRTEARLTVRVKMGSSSTIKRNLEAIQEVISHKFDNKVTIISCGYGPLYVKLIKYIVESQVKSFFIALVVITFILALIYRSIFILLLAVIPNLFPIIFVLGFMGWMGIALDIATVTVAAIAISISVDDTIHFFFMFRKLINEGHDTASAVRKTILTSGKAIATTSILLMFGYLVFCFAGLQSMIYFGFLISITMIFALLCDLILLPSLILLLWKQK
ncbi:RND transporter [Candidatus Magnetomorum sp. HK-1]|nr:RND transporter [Candidatus Magnetomorum sp. HK-1]